MQEVTSISKSVLNKVMKHVYTQSGISLEGLTCGFVDTRLRRRLRALGVSNPENYIEYIESNLTETQHLVNAFTTNETSFFRTQSLWNYLESSFLPDLAGRPRRSAAMLWSAACSTGEEAYSLAMLCDDIFADKEGPLKPRIHATDISTTVLQKAREGRFSGRTIKRLKATKGDRLKRHFEKNGDEFQVCSSMQKSIQFSRHNLMEETGKRDTYDLIMLRNVLIYFKPSDQIKILQNIVSSMKPGGILAIGESESLAFSNIELEFVQPFVYRKPEQQ